MTAIAIAASASTATAISVLAGLACPATAITRWRASARAGRPEIESNAAAKRAPPAPCGRAACAADPSPLRFVASLIAFTIRSQAQARVPRALIPYIGRNGARY